jgi:hypothetical protein
LRPEAGALRGVSGHFSAALFPIFMARSLWHILAPSPVEAIVVDHEGCRDFGEVTSLARMHLL